MGSFGDELNELRRDNTGSSKCNIAMGYYCNEIFMFIKRVKIWRKKNKDFCAIHSFSLHALSLFPSDGALRAASGGSSPLPTAGPVTLNSLGRGEGGGRTSQIGSMWKPGACVCVGVSTGCAVMCESRLSSEQLRVRSCLVMHIRNSSTPPAPSTPLTPPNPPLHPTLRDAFGISRRSDSIFLRPMKRERERKRVRC